MFLRSINCIICVVVIALFLSGYAAKDSKVEGCAPTCQEIHDEIIHIERTLAKNHLRHDAIKKTNKFFFDALDPCGKHADYYGFGFYIKEQKISRTNRELGIRRNKLVGMYKQKGCGRK